MQSTRKSLLASGLSLVASAALLVGTTFAWFTDSVTNTGNKIQAGTLDVLLAEWDVTKNDYVEVDKNPIFDYALWEPGYTDIAAVKIGNEGTLALKYQLDIITRSATDLAQVIDVYYYKDGNAANGLPADFAAIQADTEHYQKLGTLAQLLANTENGLAYGHLEAGEADFAIIALHMQESAGDQYQGASIGSTFDIVLNATQYTGENETDGFGSNQYDKDAPLPNVINSSDYNTLQDALNAAEKGDTVVLQESQVITKPLTISEDITLDLGENTLSYEGTAEKDAVKVTQDGANVTIKASGEGGIKLNAGSSTCIIITSDNANITIDGGTYTSEKYQILDDNNGAARNTHLTIKNVTFVGERGLHFLGKDSIVDVIDSTFTASGYSAFYIGGNVVCNLENVTVNGNVFAADTNGSASSGYSTINIQSGYYTRLSNSDPCTISVTGGSFTTDPTEYVDTEKYTVKKNGKVWTVTAK